MSSGQLSRATGLVGRVWERETCDQLITAVQAGESRSLVIKGDAGVGKSALLDHLTSRATECRILRVVGVQSEMELVYAGLHQLCAPLLDRIDRLPGPQADALRTAFGLCEGAAPRPFIVGLAVLGLVSEGAEEQPLLCVVDDHQWLDRESACALGFVARRLAAEPVGMVFGTRSAAEELMGLPAMDLTSLPDSDARALLESVMTRSLDSWVVDQVVADSGGNPLALLEWARGMAWDRLAGGYGLPVALSVPGRIEASFVRQLAELPDPTQRLVWLAAADPSGDAALVWRAAGRLGIGLHAATPAVAGGLIEFTTRAWFRHPLLRSAAYQSMSAAEKRQIHLALAEVTDPELDPDREAWHRAEAAEGCDEEVAEDLERSAIRAQARGGPAAAAAFLQRAAMLSADPTQRGKRLLAAAEANLQAGVYDSARTLLAAAAAGPLDPGQQAVAEFLRGQIAFASGLGNDAPPPMLRAARLLERIDLGQARETYLAALMAAMFAGGLASGANFPEVARAAVQLPRSSEPDMTELILHALSLAIAEGSAAAATALWHVVELFNTAEDLTADDAMRWGWFAPSAALALWDHGEWRRMLERCSAAVRTVGALDRLPVILASLGTVTAWSGNFTATDALIAESEEVCQATGAEAATSFAPILLACLRGEAAAAQSLIDATIDAATATGNGSAVTFANWALAVLHNSRGCHGEALAAADRAIRTSPFLFMAKWALVEMVEAAAITGDIDCATTALEQLEDSALPGGADFGLALVARSRALLSQGETADRLYREAIECLARTESRVELGRAHLMYGEWLRREGHSEQASEQLRTAYDMFAAMGADGFAERTRRELLATGKRVRRQSAEATSTLTARELLIARLADEGRSNPEIGAQLFLSARTVEWHLSKVFGKLNITSRRELAGALDRAS